MPDMTDLEEPFLKKKQEDSEIVIVPLEVPNTKDGSLPQQQQGQGGIDQKKLGLEKVLVLGLWIWPLLWFVVGDMTDTEPGIWGEVILLILLKINQWVQKDYKPMLASNLIPLLIFLSLTLTFGFAYFDLPWALPFWTLLLIIIVTSRGSSPTTFRCVIDFTNKFKSPQQTALRWGQWVWPNVLLLVVILARGPSYGYYVNLEDEPEWYGLLSIGNGAGLFLLWCRKQDPSQDKHHKQLFVSEVIPTVLFALLPDGVLFMPLLSLFVGIPAGIIFMYPRAAHERYKRIEIIVNGRFSSFERCLTGTSFREMEEEYFIDVKEKEEEEERQLQLQQDRLAYLEDLSLSTDTTTRTTWSRLGLIAGVLLLFASGFNIFSSSLNIPQSNSSEKYASGYFRESYGV